jgi:hypothetical protein
MSRPEIPENAAGAQQLVVPPAPPGESLPEAVGRTRAVAAALIELGEKTPAARIVEHLHTTRGLELAVVDVEIILNALFERARVPPGPDQPPPDAARPAPRSAG